MILMASNSLDGLASLEVLDNIGVPLFQITWFLKTVVDNRISDRMRRGSGRGAAWM